MKKKKVNTQEKHRELSPLTLESVPALEGTIEHRSIGIWCRDFLRALSDSPYRTLDQRIRVYTTLRAHYEPFREKLKANKWASYNFRLVVDAIEGIDHILRAEEEDFAQGLRLMLPAAYLTRYQGDPSFKTVTTAARFLCAALEMEPCNLLKKINESREHFDALSLDPETAKRGSRDTREQLYCLITFLQIDAAAKDLKSIIDRTENNRTSELTGAGSTEKKNHKGNPVELNTPVLHISPPVFYAYVESLYTWTYEPWQTPARLIRHHFRVKDSKYLSSYVESLKKLNEDVADSEIIDIPDTEPHAYGDGGGSDVQRERRRLALEFVAGERLRTGNPSALYAVLLKSLYEGYLQYCGEHSAIVSADGAFGHAKFVHKDMTAVMQLRIWNAYPTLVQEAFSQGQEHLVPALKNVLKQRLSERERHANSWPTVPRLFVAASRAFVAQGFGRSAAAALSLYCLANIADSNVLPFVACAFIVETFLLVSSAAFLAYRNNQIAAPNNHRRITKSIVWFATAMSLCTPMIAAASYALEDDIELEIKALLANNTTGNSTAADQARLDYLVSLQEAGGITAFMIGGLLSASAAKIIRQLVQTVTVTQFSAGTSVTYLDNTPLSDDDRENVNALRDGLYVLSTVGFLLASNLTPISPAVWSVAILSIINEALDEINPDIAIWFATLYRNSRSRFRGSNAEFAIHRSSTPHVTAAQFGRHFLPQAGSRISFSGISDVLSQLGDILRIKNYDVASKTFKCLSVVVSGIVGARRGAMVSYIADNRGSIPSGLPSLLFRWCFRDAVGRIQERPVASSELVSLNWQDSKLGEPRQAWSWRKGRHLEIDGKLLANVFPPDKFDTFHQCEHEHVRLAVLNMLIMHWRNNWALLLNRSKKELHSLTFPELVDHVEVLRTTSTALNPPSPLGLLPELFYSRLDYQRKSKDDPWKSHAAADTSAACMVYKDVDRKTRAVFARRISDLGIDDAMDGPFGDQDEDASLDSLEDDALQNTVGRKGPMQSQFRFYSPLTHVCQLETSAQTMSQALRNFLTQINAADQSIEIAYHLKKESAVDSSEVLDEDFYKALDRFLKEKMPALPALPGDIEPVQPQIRKDSPKPKIPATVQVSKVVSTDCFSGAIKTLIDDFLSRHVEDEAQRNAIRKNIDQIRRNRGTNRPKWSEVPDALSTAGIQFIFAKAMRTRGDLSLSDPSGIAIRSKLINSLWTLAISHKRNQDDLQSVLSPDAGGNYVATEVKSGKMQHFLSPDTMEDALFAFMENEKVFECSLLFIDPARPKGRSSHTESSSSDEGSKTPRVSKEETPRLPALPGDIESTQPQTGIDSPSAKIPLPVQVSLVVSSDCFSGAINTLINDFLLRHIDVEAKRNALRKIIDQIKQKRGNSRPKWSEVPKTLAMDDVKFVYATASIKNKQLSIKDASGDIDRSSINALHVLAVSYKGKNDSDVREAIYIEKGGFLASSFNDGKPVQMSDPSKKAGSMWEVLAFFMDSKKLSECSLLFIVPPPHSSRRASPSSDTYSESPSGRSMAEIESGDASANKNLVEVELPYKVTDAWKANGLAFERVVNASDPLAGAVKTLCLHYLRGEATMELVVHLLGETSSKLPKGKGCDWRVLATTNLARQLPFKFATVDRQKLELKYNPNLRKSVCELQVLAVRIDNDGAVGGDYVIFKCSDTQYIAVHTGTAERYAFELDAQVALANMDSALLHFLKNEVRMTSCSILFIGG